jgi:quercetin dioxygenase-like cupin family protein
MANMHFVPSGSGDTFDLGVVKMKLLASGEDTNGQFALAEWDGSEGPWTIPHLHRHTQESFYVLDGEFTFVCDGQEIAAEAGSYLLVPPGTPHVLRADTSRGRLLTVMAPGGLEGMFRELSELPSDSLRDPATRAAVSARYDSIPV